MGEQTHNLSLSGAARVLLSIYQKFFNAVIARIIPDTLLQKVQQQTRNHFYPHLTRARSYDGLLFLGCAGSNVAPQEGLTQRPAGFFRVLVKISERETLSAQKTWFRYALQLHASPCQKAAWRAQTSHAPHLSIDLT